MFFAAKGQMHTRRRTVQKAPEAIAMADIYVEEVEGPGTAEAATEIVERKGLGHPDTICDSVMESISQALCRLYVERCGAILHHNCDKGMLVAGRVERRFGGGRVVEPMRLIIGDRATAEIEGVRLPIADLAVETAASWFHQNLRHVDPEAHIDYQVELKPGSEELQALFRRRVGLPQANDTSAAVGYAPLSETERLVLETERYLNSTAFKQQFPETGEDVKVMGVRKGSALTLTVAMPLLDRHTDGEARYFARKDEIQEHLLHRTREHLRRLHEVFLGVNMLDRPGAGLAGMYLSVLGTSAEDADSGEVGRGNQVNGLISLSRPSGSEIAPGKNPVSHVGKIYNVLTHLLAERIHSEVTGLREVLVWMCSRIGDPVDQPQIISVQIRTERGVTAADVESGIREILDQELAQMERFCSNLAQGRYSVC
jgi:S-adenosylmethionine synthetase